MSVFGETVRWRRKAVGMNQAELAALIKRRHRPTTASYISRIESGEIDPRLSTVYSLARALHVKPWQLVAELGENVKFWEGYLDLNAAQKHELQRHITWMHQRGR